MAAKASGKKAKEESGIEQGIIQRLSERGYSIPETVEIEGTKGLLVMEDGHPAVYVYLLEAGRPIDPEEENLAQLYGSQVEEGPADYVWAANGEMDYFFSWLDENQMSELPSREEWESSRSPGSKVRAIKTDPVRYRTLQKEFDDLHEYIYAARENVNSKNDITYDLCKFIFMKYHLEKNRDYKLKSGKKLETIFSPGYVGENKDTAVEEIKTAFTEIRDLDQYNIEDDQGHNFRIFDSSETIKLNKTETFIRITEMLNKYTLSHPEEQGLEDDILGRAFDVMLRSRFESKGGLGIYLTPQPVRDAAVQIAMHDLFKEDPQILSRRDPVSQRLSFRVLDLCGGSGGFLITAMREVRRRINAILGVTDEEREKILEELFTDCFMGADNAPGMVLMARINMILHGDPKARVFQVDNSLTSPVLLPESTDLIVTNPPFKKGGINEKEGHGEILEYFRKDIEDQRFLNKSNQLALGAKPDKQGRWKPVASVDPAVLFIDRCLQLLKPGGRLMMVVPDGILCNSGDRYVREYMMGKKDEETGKFVGGKAIVKAVISLPPVTFSLSGAGAKTSLLYLQKKGPGIFEQGPIFMAVANEVGFDVKKNKEVITGRNDLVKIVEAYKVGY
ncbi:MAG: HsdM family class I SAM-dependent methyltransferase [Deltaproteobacteria bacterium]